MEQEIPLVVGGEQMKSNVADFSHYNKVAVTCKLIKV